MTIDLRNLFGLSDALNKKFVDALLKAVKSNALKEFDYLKFKQSVSALSEMQLDQATSYRSAFATASTVGLTKEKLMRTAKHYLNTLNKEKLQFADAMKNQMDQRVAKKREEAETLSVKLEEYQAKIERMQREMAAYEKKIANVDQEIEKAKRKIEDTRQHFMEAYDGLVKTIESDVELIDQYL